MPLKFAAYAIVIGIALLHSSTAIFADQPDAKADEVRRNLGALMRLASDPRLVQELDLTAEQRKQIQISSQKFRDAMMAARGDGKNTKFDTEANKKLVNDLLLDAGEILTPKQNERLTELADDPKFKQRTPSFSSDKVQEMQRLNSMMMELQRLSYDSQLAEELGLTVEQKAEIREASRKFSIAMQERAAKRTTEGFDLNRYNEVLGNLMIEAQGILTAEQAEKLGTSARLKRLKQKFGDEFAMVNGLAEDFDLDPSETKELREEIVDAREQYYEDLKELKEDTLERILRALPREHREEVREAVESFLDADPRKKRRPMSGITLPN
jgi:hypothetical protein